MSFLNYNRTPVTYGAIMYNGSASGTVSCYPLFTSLANLAELTSISNAGSGTISIADIDDYWTVMPGYKIIVYPNVSYGGTIVLTGDNTSGVSPATYVISPNQNTASSVQLYFKGTLIVQPS